MRATLLAAALLTASLALPLAVPGGRAPAAQEAYRPGPHNIVVPPDFATRFVRYTTVDKPDRKIIRNIYVNPEAFAVLKAGQPSPDGTLIVMADQRARLDPAGNPLLDSSGRFIPDPPFIAVGAQQKKAGWGVGYGPEMRNGEWEYAAFTGDLQRREIALNGCFACHLPLSGQDYNFTLWDYQQKRR